MPWKDFLSLKAPQLNFSYIEQRVLTTLVNYRVNYAIICLVVFALRLVFSPFLLLSMLLISAVSIFVLLLYKKPLIVFGVMASASHKRIACGAFAVLVLVITGTLEKLLWTGIFSLVLVGIHLVGRPRSVGAKPAASSVFDVQYPSGGSFDPESGGDGSRSVG